MIEGGLVLSLPALFAVGLASSPHCLLMCAPLTAQTARARLPALFALHAGRLSSYTLLGAASGGVGALLLWSVQRWHLSEALRWAAAAILVLLGLRQLWRQSRLPACCRARPAGADAQIPSAYAHGLLWGFNPCAPLYSVLGLAALSGSAGMGAGLALAFGLGNSPLLLAGSGLGRRLLARLPEGRQSAAAAALSIASGLWLIAPAVFGSTTLGAWCSAVLR